MTPQEAAEYLRLNVRTIYRLAKNGSQQRSGQGSAVTRFISTKPFPLNYSLCSATHGLDSLVERTIREFGGIRGGRTIGKEVEYNYTWLEKQWWQVIYEIVKDLEKNPFLTVSKISVLKKCRYLLRLSKNASVRLMGVFWGSHDPSQL